MSKLERLDVLERALRHADFKATIDLLKQSSYTSILNEQNNHGMTPLHTLCSRPLMDPDVVKQITIVLLKSGASKSLEKVDDEGYTPIHYATLNGYLDVVKIMIENGASVLAKTNFKFTPLHNAVSSQNVKLVEYLLSTKQCDLNAINEFNATPLELAILHQQKEITDLLQAAK
ncbi:cyclin-dependent kinase inhibitor [Acrasis kona]|uniref:Cyclin-dependent kinase inhibitor n=1 Tax=Acrasis kona TaxID=1008807 RepID=A0AAW2ZLN9_9EUKA